jgi:hypothetical protein
MTGSGAHGNRSLSTKISLLRHVERGDRRPKLHGYSRIKFVELRSDRMSSEASETDDRAQRFRDTALPHLDQVYTVARYLMRNSNDAEDAVQECYLRALRHFDSFQGPAMKPWLLAILKNVRNAEFMRRSEEEVPLRRSRWPEASPYDFSCAKQLIERAAENARKWIDGGGLTRPEIPDSLLPHSH